MGIPYEYTRMGKIRIWDRTGPFTVRPARLSSFVRAVFVAKQLTERQHDIETCLNVSGVDHVGHAATLAGMAAPVQLQVYAHGQNSCDWHLFICQKGF